MILGEWNPRSLIGKQHEFKLVMSDFNFDALFLPELWTNAGSKIQVPTGYELLRNDRQTGQKGGGVGWLVRKSLRLCAIRKSESGDEVEYMAIKVESADGRGLWLVGVYVPHGNHDYDPDFLLEFAADAPTMVCGDFNTRHEYFGLCDGSAENQSGKRMFDFLSTGAMVLLGDKTPTHVHGNRLDIWFCTPELVESVRLYRVGCLYNSDHCVTAIEFDVQASWRAYPPVRPCYNRTNFASFRSVLDDDLGAIAVPVVSTPGEVKRYSSEISAAINHAKAETVVYCPVEQVPRHRTSPEIRACIKERHKFSRLYRRTGRPVYQHLANQAYARFKNLVAKADEEATCRKMRRLEKSRRTNLKQFFQLLDQVKSGTGASRSNGVQPLKAAGSGRLVVSDTEKAELLGEHMAKAVRQVEVDDPSEEVRRHHQDVTNFVAEHADDFKPLDSAPLSTGIRVSRREFRAAIRRLKLKAPGHDDISNLLLKRGGPVLWNHLRRLFNMSLACGFVPEDWKLAIIVPLPRPGKDLSTPGGYRPVSLLPTMAKLLEMILALRLRDLFERHGLLPLHQSGFRQFHSTTDQTFRFSQLAAMARLKKEILVSALLDFEGAFNAVWHDGLRKKLYDCPFIDKGLVRWISSYLEGRAFVVRVSGDLSATKFGVGAGVPQGSALSPILFAFFTADLYPDDPGLGRALAATYADDVLVYEVACWLGLAQSRVQEALRRIERWSRLWKLPLNPAKCQVLVFGSYAKPDLRINDQTLPVVNAATYLGVTFDCRQIFQQHFDKVVKDAKARIAALRSLCYPGSPVSFETRRLVYLATIRPVLEYSCAAFVHASAKQLRRLVVLQNDALRAILEVDPREHLSSEVLCRRAAVPMLLDRFVQLATGFAHRALAHVPPVAALIRRDAADPEIGQTPLGVFKNKLLL